MSDRRFGAYTILSKLATGGMAEIYLARQDSVGGFVRQVVVKQIHGHLSRNERLVSMFLDEARLLARMSHPNIATVFDFRVEDEAHCLVMEYVNGVTLKEAVRASRGIEPSHALRIAVDVCSGLHYAHSLTDDEGESLHVVHRDVTPQNVLLSFDGVIKLIDFGIAKASFSTDRTKAGAIKGKYAYMSPEQIMGKPYDHRADQHAVGIILWEMLTGQRLYYRGNIHASLQAVLKERPAPLGFVSSELRPLGERLDPIIARALAKDPKDRFESCEALQNELEDAAFELQLRSNASRLAVFLREIFEGSEPSKGYGEASSGRGAAADDGAASVSDRPQRRALVDDLEEEGITLVVAANGEVQPRRIEPPTPEPPPTAPVTNLESRDDELIGRGAELERLRCLFEQGNRLVTLHGPAGVGKSRLALEFGLTRLDDYSEGGVWLVELASATSLEAVCFELARVLGVPLLSAGSEGDPVEQVSHALAARGTALIILDAVEHVSSVVVQALDRWLELAPAASFLVSSRDRLGLDGEVLYEVYPLSTEVAGADVETLSVAAQLFLERARSLRADFELTTESCSFAEAIVAQLEGLPLAIELAAARLADCELSTLLDRLRSRLEPRSRSGGDVDEGMATLRGALDWSWSALESWEKAALAQLSVFVGGFNTDAVSLVVDLAVESEAPRLTDVLRSLRDKSLVRTVQSQEFPGDLRFGLYESIRQYAREKLDDGGGREEAFERHALYYLDLCGQWAEGTSGREAMGFLRLLVVERDNLVALLERTLAKGLHDANDVARALRALLTLDPILRTRGPHTKHLEWIEVVMRATKVRVFDEAARAILDSELMARGFLMRGEARRTRTRSNESGNDFQRALELAREAGSLELEGRALVGLGNVAQGQGRIEECVRLFEEALAVQRRVRDRGAQGATLAVLGATKIWLSRLDEAQEHLEEALICLRESGAPPQEGFVLVGLGALHFERRENVEARMYVEEALGVLDRAWEPRYRGEALMYLGLVEWEDDRREEARERFDEALALSRDVGDRLFEARYLGLRSAVDACCDEIEAAERGFSRATDAAWESGSPIAVSFVDVLAGQLDLVKSRRAAARGESSMQEQHLVRAIERLSAAETPGAPDAEHPEGAPAMADVSDEVRIATRFLRRELERV